VRGAIFGALYIILGKRVWFFPNILAEEATLRELFRFCPKKDEEERPKWTTRIFYAVLAVLVILLMRHHAPDEAARARSVLNLLVYHNW
jgi:translocation protein SEC62